MATVVTYWQTQEDEKDFLAFLQHFGKVLAFPNTWFETKEEVNPKLMNEYIERFDPSQLNFALEKHALQVEVVSQQFERHSLECLLRAVVCSDTTGQDSATEEN